MANVENVQTVKPRIRIETKKSRAGQCHCLLENTIIKESSVLVISVKMFAFRSDRNKHDGFLTCVRFPVEG